MQRPIATAGTTCPLHKKDVSKVCHKCEWYTHVAGKHPQTEEMINRWGCTLTWLPMLLINTAQEVRQGAAATESFRNDVVKVGSALVAQNAETRRVTHTEDLKRIS